MKRGIFLVANKKSQKMCENLIYSIRQSGCSLPIRLVHFGGDKINSLYIKNEVELLELNNFGEDAKKLIKAIQSVLLLKHQGYLYRYLAWFCDWDQFLYSDNDIVALCNWTNLFDYLEDRDFVHADEEYTTNGAYDYNQPELLKGIFGSDCLETALTSGHIIVKPNKQMVSDFYDAVKWFELNSSIPKKNDQAFMHVSSMLGKWNKVNLCQAPNNWLSSWAGDYRNSLKLIQTIQLSQSKISHIHYSGSTPKGDLAIEDLLFSKNSDRQRLVALHNVCLKALSGYDKVMHHYTRAKRVTFKKLIEKVSQKKGRI